MSASPFKLNQTISFLTKHEKQKIVAPVLKHSLDVNVEHTSAFDTDTLGTFDGSKERILTPVEAALKKAKLACELTNNSQGIGSEGSFFGHAGAFNLNEEVMAFVDIEKNVEVIGFAKAVSPLSPVTAHSANELNEHLSVYDSEQCWIFESEGNIHKGKTLKQLLDIKLNWPLELQPDFRAMCCPSRQAVIKSATENLLERLSSLCPACGMVDFCADKSIQGLPCEICEQPTNAIQYQLASCKYCGFEKKLNVVSTKADPYHCVYCNP